MSLRSNKFLFVVLFSNCYAFVSCKKDDAPPALQNGSYTEIKAADYSSARLFTKWGEVTDQHVLNAYKVRFATDLSNANGAGAPVDSFSVIDGNTVTYDNRRFTVARVDNFYQFRSDTVKTIGWVEPLAQNGVKYKPYFIAEPFAPSQFYAYITTFQYVYASVTPDRLVVLPMINFIRFNESANPGAIGMYSNFRINNVFDEKFPVNILNNDSVMVQSYNVYYKK